MEFSYYIDQKVTTWERMYFTLVTDNKEKADEIAKQFYNEEIYLEVEEYERDASWDENIELSSEHPVTRELYRRDNEELIINNSI